MKSVKNGGITPHIRAIHSLSVAAAVKLYRNGKHPEIFHENEYNLLSEFHYHNDSLEDLIYIYGRIAELPYDKEKHGREPIKDLFRNLNYQFNDQGKVTRQKELDYVEKLKVIINFKDNRRFIDSFIHKLITAQEFKQIDAYLKATLPSLSTSK